MKVLVIPDIHLKTWIFDQAETILKSGKADRAVCLMDMPDDWDMEFQIGKYENTFNRAIEFSKNHPDTLWCYGNHDISYVRTTNDVNITNIERSTIANENHADAFIRVHANAAESSSVQGIETICQTPGNKYNGDIYKECRKLSDCVLDCVVEATGGKKRHVWETDTMSGINWSKVPVTIVEMGYMTNPEEDILLSDSEYQKKIVKGIADGIDKFFE